MHYWLFDTNVTEGGFVIEVSGVFFKEKGEVLREQLRQALAAGHREIVLKLDGVTKMDSSGVGYVMGALTTVRRRGGSMKFVFNKYVEGVFRDCGL